MATIIFGIVAVILTTVIIITIFIGSIIMISLGIIGYYIARIFEEIKGGSGRYHRPEGSDLQGPQVRRYTAEKFRVYQTTA